MCGIAGISGRAIETQTLKDIQRILFHRGPDDDGCVIYSEGRLGGLGSARTMASGTALLHSRLSIIDLSPAASQPMCTDDGRYVVVFNGEIYNFVELRQELEALGCHFRSRSDTEVLLQAYARWGTNALPRLVGMFAFAILDTVDNTILLARDPFGIKPLYYVKVEGHCFAFASEIKALLTFSERKADPQRVYHYLRYGVTDHGEGTLIRDIHQIPAAHFMHVNAQTLSVGEPVAYWTPDLGSTLDIGFDEAARHLKQLFMRTIELHLRSDVAIGSALSGGVDSSAIVCAMRAVAGRHLDLHTFTFVAGKDGFDEEHWADIVIQFVRANGHKVHLTHEELVDDIDDLVYVQDEPFGSTNIYAQYRVFQLAKQHGIKVMLDGQGADELMAGYRSYLGTRMASLLSRGRIPEAISLLRRSGGLPGGSYAEVVQRAADHLLPISTRRILRHLVGRSFVPNWLNQSWFTRHGVDLTLPSADQGNSLLAQELHHSVSVTSLPHLLRWEDRNSMAASIESRVPFLTTDLAQFLLTLPESYLISPDGTQKAVFRRAMRGIVPDAILDRKDKIGFGAPESTWLKSQRSWVRTNLAELTALEIPALNTTAVLKEWDLIEDDSCRYGWHMWRILNLVRWTKMCDVKYD
jgi:asparagine synthase (glutamine-hydrolysing)